MPLSASGQLRHPGPRWGRRAARDFMTWSLPWLVVVLYGAVVTVAMSDLYVLREERDILKRATAFFAAGSP